MNSLLHQVNTRRHGQSTGFTIVELLIVVVVIAVLASISIVSYNGITNRANEAAVEATAATFQKKAELFTIDGGTGKYPVATSDLSADSTKSYFMSTSALTYVTFPSGGAAVPNATNLPSDSNMTKRLLVLKCDGISGNTANDTQAEITTANVTGLQVWFYNANSTNRESINIGNTTDCPQA